MATITASVSTKDRYDKGLALTIQAIIMQSVVPNKLVIWDDGECKDLRQVSPYRHLWPLISARGINWSFNPGQRIGQVANHARTLDEADTEFVWRVDDDEIPEPDVLEKLLEFMKNPKVGAVGGLVMDPKQPSQRPAFVKNRIEDIYSGQNCQWGLWSTKEPEHVDHLYSTFLYRVEAARKAGGYCRTLSPVGHREETLFTYGIKRAGYMLIVTPEAVTWHLREESGGIRSYTDQSLWAHDEEIFTRKLVEWGVSPTEHKFIVLDNGIGDHIVFRSVLPEILRVHKARRVVLFVCYPELFQGLEGVTLGSIADAKGAFGNLDRFSVYAWCAERKWTGPLADAFREMNL